MARLDVVRAIEILYAIDEHDLIAGSLADLGERSTDPVALAAIGEVAARHKDARAMALLGKAALGRGLALDHYAFPTVGIPDYHAIGPPSNPPWSTPSPARRARSIRKPCRARAPWA